MNKAQVGFGARASQLEGNGAIGNPYRKIACFNQMEGKVVGGTKWSFYQNRTKAKNGATIVN